LLKKGENVRTVGFFLLVGILSSELVVFRKSPSPNLTDQRILNEILRREEVVKKRLERFQRFGDALERLRRKERRVLRKGDTAVVRVLAIRVEFVKEEPDDSLTTGDGTMRLIDNGLSQDTVVDGCEFKNPFYDPPHDKKYFENLLLSLSNYYSSATFGRMKIEFIVKPDDDTLSYKLPHKMAYYGNLEAWPDGFFALFEDAMRAADEDPTIDFDDLDNNGIPDWEEGVYDRYIIFHAGSAWQTDIMNDSPLDIPAASILGYPFYYVVLNEGTDTVFDVSILPEMMSQDGVESRLQGTLFHEMAHNIFYLPDLYDVSGKGIGIGAWGLMGNSYYLGIRGAIPEGLITPLPNAWERKWMSWIMELVWGFGFLNEKVYKVLSPNQEGEQYEIYPAAVLRDSLGNFVKKDTSGMWVRIDPTNFPRYYEIPINDKEYFLLEYKLDNIEDNDSLYCPPETSEIFGKWKEGVVVDFFGEYDYLLPGKGLLVWHIDEEVLWENYSYNEVNAYRPMAVDLEEADGVQDLEHWTDISPYPYALYGSPYDPFFKGNNDEFSDTTNPDTRDNQGGRTMISIFSISEPKRRMHFSLRRGGSQKGFPRRLADTTIVTSYDTYDIVKEISPLNGYLAVNRSFVFVVQTVKVDSLKDIYYGPTSLLSSDTLLYIHVVDSIGRVWDGDTLSGLGYVASIPAFSDVDNNGYLDAFFGTSKGWLLSYEFSQRYGLRKRENFPIYLGESIFSTPALSDINGDGLKEVIVGTDDQKLYFFDCQGNLLHSIHTGGRARNTPAIGEKIYYLSTDGRLLIINKYGKLVKTILEPYATMTISSPILGDFDRDRKEELFLVRERGEALLIGKDGEVITKRELNLHDVSPPACGDLDGDGFLEMVFLSQNRLFVLNHTLSFLTNLPMELDSEKVITSPVVADIDMDGNSEIVLGIEGKGIYAFNERAEVETGFPLPLRGKLSPPPQITNLDSDPHFEILAIDSLGFLYAYETDSGRADWPAYGASSSHTFRLANYPNLVPPEVKEFEVKKIYLWPNPTYDGKTHIRIYATLSGRGVIRIISFGGELMKEIIRDYEGGDWFDILLDLSDLPSGVYFVRFSTKNYKKILKLSIVR